MAHHQWSSLEDRPWRWRGLRLLTTVRAAVLVKTHRHYYRENLLRVARELRAAVVGHNEKPIRLR